MSSCPNCRKPLPRCSLCLQHMGTASERPIGGIRAPHTQNSTEENSSDFGTSEGSSKTLSSFSTWFTWCHTCRHGGHANHIIQWFRFVFFLVFFSTFLKFILKSMFIIATCFLSIFFNIDIIKLIFYSLIFQRTF